MFNAQKIVLLLLFSTQALAAGLNIGPVLPSQPNQSNYYCKEELLSWVNEFVADEEAVITDKTLKKHKDILKREDFFNDYVNLSLYNRSASVIQHPNNIDAATDLKSMLYKIGQSKFGTKVKKSAKSTLIHTDFLLLYSYGVLALKEKGHLDDEELNDLLSFISKKMKPMNRTRKHHLDMKKCTDEYLGEEKFDVFACQNHAYSAQHLRMLVGVLNEDFSEIEQGLKLYRFAIDDLGTSGALWREASRGAYSWTYYPHALGSLMAIADMDKRMGGQLFSYANKRGQTIHDAVTFYVDSLANPTDPELMWRYAEKNMGIDNDRKGWDEPKSLWRHERAVSKQDYQEWFPIYAHHFGGHPNIDKFEKTISFEMDMAPEFTYHLGLNTWCSHEFN